MNKGVKFWLAVVIGFMGIGVSYPAQAATEKPVVIRNTRANLLKSPRSTVVKHRGKTYSKQVLWVTKRVRSKGYTYYRLTNHHQNLGYIRANATTKVQRPQLTFKRKSVQQDAAFKPLADKQLRVTRPDKIQVTATSHVNTKVPGKYMVTYHVTDTAGYRFNVKRSVKVRKLSLDALATSWFDDNKGEYQIVKPGQKADVEIYYDDDTTVSHPVVWGSTQPAVATVDQRGNVTPIADGMTLITATFNGKTLRVPLLVNSGKKLSMSSTDQLATLSEKNGEAVLRFKQSPEQKLQGLWVANQRYFMYSNGHQDSIGGGNNVTTLYLVGYDLFATDISAPQHVIVQTKDVTGAEHHYVSDIVGY